jgi:FkbM family methyltransferase
MLTGVGNIVRAARSPMLGAHGPISAALGYTGVWASARLPRRSEVRTARIAGWRISHTDPNSLLVLLDDIAIRGDYDFIPRTDRPTVVDAGANIGVATLAFKRAAPGAYVVAIEPSPLAHELLVRNVEQNGLADVDVHQAALAAEDGIVRLAVEEDVASMRSRVDANGSIEVRAIRLSQLVEGQIDFLKLDVEGSEEDVLTELAEAGRLRDINELVVEYHHHLPGRADRLSIILGLLETHGFTYQIAVPRPRFDAPFAFTDVLIRAVSAP